MGRSRGEQAAGRLHTAVLLAAWLGVAAAPTVAACDPGSGTSLDEVLARIEREQPRYLFIGERHAVGPVKRFAVDLVNGLVELGFDVGLYVEGFRTDCPPRDVECRTIARAFNEDAFLTLLDSSRASVHPLAPPDRFDRAARMAATVAAGTETIRVVLAGNTHVRYAGLPKPELPIFGGGMLYPHPGDLADAFPRQESLTFRLETTSDELEPYSLLAGDCEADYAVRTLPTATY